MSLLPALTDLRPEGYAALAELPGAQRYTGAQVRRWVLARGARGFEEMSDVPRPTREALSGIWRVRRGKLDGQHESRDGTLGLLTRLDDGELLESVLIPEGARVTLCLSSQVGCAVRCGFCASGIGGVKRNLSAGEMVEQVLVARETAVQLPTNYVFMGSGEPTHNLKALTQALEVMHDAEGLGIGARRITVSTVGHPEAIRKLTEIPIPFNLALSVHVADDRRREALMPGLGASDLAATLEATRERFLKTGRRLTVEIVLLDGINDADEDARHLGRLLAGHTAAVNLLPWNPVDGLALRPSPPARVASFAEVLRRAGVTTTVRRARGQDVGVACGQLRRRAVG